MMSEARVRQLLAALEMGSKQEDANPLRVIAACGGVSALKMVLEDES